MYRHTYPHTRFWKSHSHLPASNPLRRWVYVKFGALFVTGVVATPFISYFWTGAMSADTQPPETFANFPIQVALEMAPLNLMSRSIGDLASTEIVPKKFHHQAIKAIAWLYGIDLGEYPPLEHFRTTQEFFSRKFADASAARPLDGTALELVSPCDAELLQCGEVANGHNNAKTILQVKGHAYPVEGLFRMTLPMDLDNPYDQLNPQAKSEERRESEGGEEARLPLRADDYDNNQNARMYFVFHLRPGDYHRVHSPRDHVVTKTVYVPGLLYPTTHTAMRWLPNLILSNERILSFGYAAPETAEKQRPHHQQQQQQQLQQQQKKKLTAMALVGATCVGKITLSFDQRIVTNLADPPEAAVQRDYKDASPTIKKGQEFGYFNWGSCVVLIADVSRKSLSEAEGGGLKVKPGDEVRVGQRLI